MRVSNELPTQSSTQTVQLLLIHKTSLVQGTACSCFKKRNLEKLIDGKFVASPDLFRHFLCNQRVKLGNI